MIREMVWVCSHLTLNQYKLEHNFEDKKEIVFIIKLSTQRLMLSRHSESQNLTYDQEQH